MEASYLPIYKRDYKYGLNQEDVIKPELEGFFKLNLTKFNY